MPSLISKAQVLANLALDGHSKVAAEMVLGRLYGNSSAVGLRRDLLKPFQAPSANLPIVVRPLRREDDLAFLSDGGQEDSRFRFGQLRMVQADFPTCYVAVAPNGDICYMQWLIPASENKKIQGYFGSHFPVLNADQALLEGAYTVPKYRGLRIMACAMAQIAAKAEQFGVRWVITFVTRSNEPSIKGCERAGFEPYIQQHESWRMFHCSTKYGPL